MGTQVPSRKGHSPHPNFRPIYGLMAQSIKMPLGKKVGLDPSDIVLDGNPTPPPPKRGHSPPQFSAHVYCAQTAGWIKMPLGMEVDLGPGHIVLDGDPAPSVKGAQPPSPIFGLCLLWLNGWMDQDATWCEGTMLHGYMLPCYMCYMGTQLTPSPRAQPFNFWPMSIVAKRSPISATAEHF